MASKEDEGKGGVDEGVDKDTALLRKMYYENFSSPTAFATRKRLQDALKRKIDQDKISEFLAQDRIHGLYKPRPRKTFPRRKVVVHDLFSFISADLIDFQSLSTRNKNFSWILLVMDNLSKFVAARSLKKKDRGNMEPAMESILTTPPFIPSKIKYCVSDEGREFLLLKPTILDKYGIKLIHVKSEKKSMEIERMIKEITKPLMALMDFCHSLVWIDKLDYIVTRHNTMKLPVLNNRSPLDIINNPRDQADLKLENARKLIAYTKKHPARPRFFRGDRVRTLLRKKLFEKNFTPKWSEEIRVIKNLIPTTPLTYAVAEYPSPPGNVLRHHFYEHELQLVSPPQIRSIDDLKENKKKEEKESKTPLQQQHEDENRELYIAGTRRPESRSLRSGKETLSKIEYELRDFKRPKFVRFIDSAEKKQLEDDGILSAPPK